MLARFLELQPAVVAAIRTKELSGLKERDIYSLTDEEVTTAEDLQAFLQPLKNMTTYMCSEEMPTSSIILPLLHSLVGANGHLRPREGDSPVVAKMKEVMSDDLKSRYSEQKEMLNIITALDPRFKSFPYMSEEERDGVFNSLVTTTVSLHYSMPAVKEEPSTSADPSLPRLPAFHGATAGGDGAAQGRHDEDEDLEVHVPWEEGSSKKEAVDRKPPCLLNTLLNDVYVTHVVPAKSQHQLCFEEVAKYRGEPSLDMSQNPLMWWKMSEPRYPHMSRVAKMYLCVPATSVQSERVFSTAGDILTPQRASLKPKHVDKLLFLKKNLK